MSIGQMHIEITTPLRCTRYFGRMNADAKIFPNRQPRRPHHVVDWCELRGLTQADLAREIGADKSLVSRWFSGTTPNKEYQIKLAAFFGTDEEGIFRHPYDDWLTKFLRGRSSSEMERIKTTLEAAFPRKTG